jgi:hypothetical protein
MRSHCFGGSGEDLISRGPIHARKKLSTRLCTVRPNAQSHLLSTLLYVRAYR